jgi:hypothetical protein
MRTIKKRKVRNNRHRRQTRKTHLQKYFFRIIRGGGNFWNEKCEPEPKLTPEMMETEEFKAQFNTVLDHDYNLIFGEYAEGANNKVHDVVCHKTETVDYNAPTYAFRESIGTLSHDNPEKRKFQIQNAYDEVYVSAELAQKGLGPKIHMAGIYKIPVFNRTIDSDPLKNNHIFQIMEHITPFKSAISDINDSEKPPAEKSELVRHLFAGARTVYKEAARNLPYLFLDLKPGNLGVRGDVLSFESQVLMIDADPYFNMLESNFNKLLDRVNKDEYATNLYGSEKYRKETMAQFMAFMFASNTYMIWKRSNYFKSPVLAPYPFIEQMLIEMLGTPAERELMHRLQTIMYDKVERYRDVFNKYILSAPNDKSVATRLGIIPDEKVMMKPREKKR